MKKTLLPLVATALIVSACAQPATPAPTSAPDQPTDAPPVNNEAPTAVPTTASTDATSEAVTLRLSSWGSPEQNAPTAEMVAAFMAHYPNITVEEEYDPWDGYWEKKTTQLAGNQLPDVYAMSTAFICDYVASGRVLDVSPSLQNADVAGFVDGLPGAALENLTLDGELYGFPYATGTVLLFYNKDMFDAAGLDYPTAEWTYQNVLDAGAALTKDRDGDGVMDEWGYYVQSNSPDTFYSILSRFDARFFSDDASTVELDSPQAVEAVQFIQDLQYKYNISPRPQDIDGVESPFASNMVAMYEGLVGEVGTFREITDFTWDVAPLPLGFKGQEGVGVLRGNPNYVVSAATAHPAEATLLAAFMSSAEAQTLLGQAKGRIPVHPAGQKEWLTAPPENLVAAVELSMSRDVANPPLCINHNDEIFEAWARALEGDILLNSAPAAELLPTITQDLQKILDTQ